MMDDAPRPVLPALAPISLIVPDLPPYGIALYVGDRHGASNMGLLRDKGITTVVNCAVNMDINIVDPDAIHADTGGLGYGPGLVRYYKIGLIDGAGNADTMLLGGYFLIRGALGQVLPDKPSYPRREYGNVLINCRGGRSRSVILAALLLHHLQRDRFPSLDGAIAEVQTRRGLHAEELYKSPKPALIEAAHRVSEWIDQTPHVDPVRQAR